jgi:hypothetical protein
MKVIFFALILTLFIYGNAADIVTNPTSGTATNSTKIPANFTCKTSQDCNNHGICNTTINICICNDEFDTFFVANSTEKVSMCNYEKKKQTTTLLLSLLVGFGAEHFYLGNVPLAVAKLVFYIFCYGMNLIILVLYKFSENLKPYLEFIGEIEFTYLSCALISILLWNIYDWVNIINNVYSDVNTVPMKAW